MGADCYCGPPRCHRFLHGFRQQHLLKPTPVTTRAQPTSPSSGCGLPGRVIKVAADHQTPVRNPRSVSLSPSPKGSQWTHPEIGPISVHPAGINSRKLFTGTFIKCVILEEVWQFPDSLNNKYSCWISKNKNKYHLSFGWITAISTWKLGLKSKLLP